MATEPSDGQPTDGQPTDGQPTDGQPTDAPKGGAGLACAILHAAGRVPPALAALACALLVLLPFLGQYGLWEPHEFAVADLVREVAKTGDFESVAMSRPPLTVWLATLGVQALGVSELGARLPLALLGIAGVMAAYFLGARLRSPRAGLIAAIVLVSSPLHLFQSRQLTSDVATASAAAIAMLGLLGLLSPRAGASGLARAGDAALAALGLGLGALGGGVLLGVLVPVASIAVASAVALGTEHAAANSAAPRALRMTTLLFGGLTLALVALVVTRLDGTGFSAVLGGTLRKGPPPAGTTFDLVVDQVAFGMFPWSALAPIAVLALVLAGRRGRAGAGDTAVLVWCLLAYAAATFYTRRLGDVRYPGTAGIAVAIGLFLDGVWEPARARVRSFALPLAAVFVLLATLQLARDNVAFPDELVGVHLLGSAKFPAEPGLLRVILAAGVLFGLLGYLALSAHERGLLGRLRRHALPGALGVGLLFGCFLSWGYTPRVSQHFSYKNLFDTFHERRSGSERLGVMGIPGSGPDYYAGKNGFEKLVNLQALLGWLRRPERVFAISPASDLCSLNQKAGPGGLEYHVLDDRNSRYFLYSNRLAPGETDSNPLLHAVRRERPADIGTPVSATFVPDGTHQRGKLELLGVKLPRTAAKGGTFEVSLFFQVHEAPSAAYKVFAHFDRASGRFQGDHDPIGGRCGTQHWQAGDFVIDTFEVSAGSLTTARGEYELFIGFFTGSAGQWKNMKVTSGNGDSNNRVRAGRIELTAGGGGCSVAR